MSWGKLDDQFHSHPKVIAAENDGAGVYARALSYCAAYYTDGFVAKTWAATIAKKPLLAKVTRSGLWVEVKAGEWVEVEDRRDSGNRKLDDVRLLIREDGFFIPDYLHHNPTRVEAELAQAKRRSAGRKGGASTSEADAQAEAKHTLKQTLSKSPSTPPTRPVRSSKTSEIADPIEADFHALRLFREVREQFQSPQLKREILGYAHKLPPADFQSIVDSLGKHRREIKNEQSWVSAALAKRLEERTAA